MALKPDIKFELPVIYTDRTLCRQTQELICENFGLRGSQKAYFRWKLNFKDLVTMQYFLFNLSSVSGNKH